MDLPINNSADFIEHMELWVFDLNQSNVWLKQDPTKFLSVVDMFEYAIRMKQHGFPIRFSYSWELEDEMSQQSQLEDVVLPSTAQQLGRRTIGEMRQQALEDLR